uniref:Small ribosomal subunit protein mS26 n=1 Tax=Capra hircus TaxID=9925 RepID=A0A8C2PG85_CAPHI
MLGKTLGARPLGHPPAQFLLLASGQKTRHNPPAKSKIGRVVTPPAVDPVELFVLTEHYWQYRQTVRALRQEFVTEVRRKVHEARAGDLAERKVLQDAAEHRELMAWNQAENQRLPELRRPGCGRRLKAVLTGRFIPRQAHLKEQENHQINNLTLH